MAEGLDGRHDKTSSPVCSTPSDYRTEMTDDSRVRPRALPRPHYYEELFCGGRGPAPAVTLAGALVASLAPESDVVKRGYLGKQERAHRRYFVLRAGSHTGPSRLEWYKSLEEFPSRGRSARKTTLFGSNKQGVIYLRCCLGVSRTGSARKGHMVALYAKDQTVTLVMDDQQQQDDWYVAVKRLMEEEQRDEEGAEGLDEEDDGYCTLPSSAYFKEVWPVTVKSRGVGGLRFLAGANRLCLTPTSLIVMRVRACDDLPSVTIPLLSVRRFGHLDDLFFLELGRSAPNGPGEIWMEAGDQGDQASAQHIHEAVREAVRALRALPDFSRPPASNHLQVVLPYKRCRTRCRDKVGTGRAHSSLPLLPGKPEIRTSPSRVVTLSFPADVPSNAQQRAASHTDRYMDMTVNSCSEAGSLQETWGLTEEEEEEEEGPGYMVMSPQVSHSPPASPLGDYMSMASPHRPKQPGYFSAPAVLQTSIDGRVRLSSGSGDDEDVLVGGSHSSPKSPSKLRLASSASECSSSDHWPSTSEHQVEQNGFSAQLLSDLGRVTIPSAPATATDPKPGLKRGTKQSAPSPTESDPPIRGCWLSMCFLTCFQARRKS